MVESMKFIRLLVFIIRLSSYSYNHHGHLLKSTARLNSNTQQDWISNIFGKFLPKPEDVGLTRYNVTSRPENFPCDKSRSAALLPEDMESLELQMIRPLLAGTNLETRPLQLIYDANRDGWNTNVFHSKVDKLGPAVVLCRSESNIPSYFGGYNPTGWVNYGEYRGSIAAFLFSFPDDGSTPIKLAKISGAGLAQIDDGSGPKFGMEGLVIPLEKRNAKLVRCKLGLYYEKLPKGKNSFLPNFKLEDQLSDLKVYVGIYQPDEKIPYSDAIPFAIN